MPTTLSKGKTMRSRIPPEFAPESCQEFRRERGFTLIELMIALAILAIISAVAVPLYTQYSQRTFRAEAQADLMRCAQGMERVGSMNFTYVNALDTDADGVGDANTGAVTPNVCTIASNNYTITIEGPPTVNTFIVRAVPAANTPVTGTGNVEMDSAGNRRWDSNADGDFDDAYEDSWTH
jgi:type IV pilus assembly protein PilE